MIKIQKNPSISPYTSRSNLKLSFRCVFRLDWFIKVHKDKNKLLENSVDYKLPCRNCDVCRTDEDTTHNEN